MTTANDIVAGAMNRIDRLEPGEPLAAEDAATVLNSLNQMLPAWELEYGVNLGHFDLVLTDTVTLPDSHIRTVIANLAIDIAPEFQTPTRAETILFAERGLRALQGIYGTLPEMGFDAGLRSRVRNAGGTERFNG